MTTSPTTPLFRVLADDGQQFDESNVLSTAHAAKWNRLSSGRLASIVDANNCPVPETDPLLIQKEAFCKLLDELRAKDQTFHLDDSPSEIVNVQSGLPIFTDAEAESLGDAIDGFRGALGNDLLWQVAWPFLNDDPADASSGELNCE